MTGLQDTEIVKEIRRSIQRLCADFTEEYWRSLEPDGYPEEFVAALTREGWLAILIPEEFGGAGLGLDAACAVLQEIHAAGGNAAACHAQMYTMAALLRHGRSEQKARYLPRIASGALRLQSMAVTEPDAGSDTTHISTVAHRTPDGYVINGNKVFISRAQHTDLMIVLARTTPTEEVEKPSMGMSLFLIDLHEVGDSISIRPIKTMMNHATTEVVMANVLVPEDALIGTEGLGFRYILDTLNAERILISAECIGDGRWFTRKSVDYGNDRVVFGRPIGMNQGVQFPIARAYAAIQAADLMCRRATWLFDSGQPCGPEANMAKLLASEASWQAANACLDTHGGWGFAVEYHVERKFRETRLYSAAPVTNNLILSYVARHVLGLPNSY